MQQIWLLIAKILFGPFIVVWSSWDIYNYYKEFNNWTKAQGLIIGRRASGRSVYLIIKFQPNEDKEIEFESTGFIMFLDLLYRKGQRVRVFYPMGEPDKAIMETIYTPVLDIVGFIAGLWFCHYFMFR